MMEPQGMRLLLAFALLFLRSAFGFAGAGHAFEGFHFGGLAFVALLFHPGVEFGAEFIADGGEFFIGDEVRAVPGVGLAIVEFLGGALLVVVDEAFRVRVTRSGHLLPGFEDGVIGGGILEGGIGCEIPNVAVARVPHAADAEMIAAAVDAAGGRDRISGRYWSQRV